MVDMAAIAGAASALKSAFDISKVALELRDANAMHGKVIEMQREIGSALASAITAQTDQMAMLKQVETLETEVARLKAWDSEKPKYELVVLETGAPVYMLKKEERGTEPPHWLCPQCFTNGKKGFVVPTGGHIGRAWPAKCLECSQTIAGTHRPYWIEKSSG